MIQMSDEDLLEYAVQVLQESYQNREEPFHLSHIRVDLVRMECERRGRPEIFDQAFDRI